MSYPTQFAPSGLEPRPDSKPIAMNHLPQFSIDLDSELKKISQRQHLNDVHYLVALVRHALSHHPQKIDILSRKNQLIFAQDGMPIDEDEWGILIQLLDPNGGSEDDRQRALEMLETVYGIALLSIFLNFSKVVLICGDAQIRKENGSLNITRATGNTRGYQLRIDRPRAHREKEYTELCFYCSGAKVPIAYNSASINQPLQLSPTMLAMNFKTQDGYGCVGIPAEGELSRFYFYKAGIRIGVKTSTPTEGRIIEGFWNANSPAFESLYHQTIQASQPLLESHTRKLYRAIPAHFPQLPAAYRMRLRKILLGMAPLGWAAEYGKVPLFANSHHACAICLEDLMKLQKQFEILPFLPKPRPKAPAILPVLSNEDQYFLGRQLNMILSPFLGGDWPKAMTAIPLHLQKTRTMDATPWASSLKALNRNALPHTFALTTAKASYWFPIRNGQICIQLNPNEPLVDEALRAIEADPSTAAMWRYRLIGTLQRA